MSLALKLIFFAAPLLVLSRSEGEVTPEPTPNLPVVIVDEQDVPMVFVPAGTFRMGATLEEASEVCERVRPNAGSVGLRSCEDIFENTVETEGAQFFITPAETISLESFYIDQYEVTLESYQKCVDENICNPHPLQYIRDFEEVMSPEEPVRDISYLDAENYCEWRGGLIPLESEWEYAARGPDSYTYHWGNEFDGRNLNFCDANCTPEVLSDDRWDDGFAGIAPVNAHDNDRSWVGAIGMAGNISEWTATLYGQVPDGINPNNLINERVVKGGYFNIRAQQLASWHRLPMGENEIRDAIGFRCVRTTEP